MIAPTVAPLRLLILGGTGFVGPHLVEAARARGFAVTLFNRGLSDPHRFPDVEALSGDRDGDLSALAGRTWDAVIDTSSFVPRVVREAAVRLRGSIGRYVLLSTIAVYPPQRAPRDERSPVRTIADPTAEAVTLETYGALKALCERAAEATLPGRVLALRAGDIVGPGDPTDRFTYWPVRVARGGDVLAPGTPDDLVQYIDVRDLAEWTLSMISAGRVGVYNAVGPRRPLRMGDLLDTCKQVTGSDARVTFADASFPAAAMPLWSPRGAPGPVTNERACEEGLCFRPLAVTLGDTLSWWQAQPAERRAHLRAGLTSDREIEVLDALARRPERARPGSRPRDRADGPGEDALLLAERMMQRGFASPGAGLDPGYLDLLVVEHARHACEMFLDRRGALLEERGGGLVSVARRWLAGDMTFDTVWDLAFGETYFGLFQRDDDDLVRRAGHLGLRLHACGHEGEWEIALRRPASLRFDRWLLPPADWARVSAVSGVVSIHTRLGDVLRHATFERSDEGWAGDDARPLPVLRRDGVRCVVLPPEVLEGREFAAFHRDLDRDDPASIVAGGLAAVGLMADYAPTYLPWVGRVLRYLVPLRRGLGVSSGSDSRAPGVVMLSNVSRGFALAETLIHEAAHQYFFILNRRGPMDDGTDTRLYYSPFREMDRPIFNILLSYHAFGNLLLFYREALARGLPRDHFFINDEETLASRLAAIEPVLQGTTALTPLGRALWEPLHERIHRGAPPENAGARPARS
jgi:2'-hydroxyisoflavone reductase